MEMLDEDGTETLEITNIDKLVAFLLVVMAIMIVAMITYGVMGLYTESQCLKQGYRDSKVDWFLNQYCIKRVDQTDIVVPLKK